jgi:hypothetical protein
LQIGDDPVDPVFVRMKGIVTELEACHDIDQETGTHTDGKSQGIDDSKNFIPGYITECDFEIIFQHMADFDKLFKMEIDGDRIFCTKKMPVFTTLQINYLKSYMFRKPYGIATHTSYIDKPTDQISICTLEK